jgi:hypothetical protein
MHISVLAPLLSAAFEHRLHLDHGVSRYSAARVTTDLDHAPVLVRDSGRHSAIVTVSPSRDSFVLVVRQQLGRAADVLAVTRMLDEALDQRPRSSSASCC